MEINWNQVEELVDRALVEDLGCGDVTTEAIIPSDQSGIASIVAKVGGILAGVEVARVTFSRVDPSVKFDVTTPEGSHIQPGDIVAKVEGKVASILKAERVALNFLQRLSGIATATSDYVEAVKDFRSRIVDTRKTTPGLRILEKYAVRIGGGYNHRLHLGGGVLIKDNHLAVLRSQGLDMKDIVAMVKGKAPFTLKVEIEVRTVEEALEATEAGADIVMLDNMSPEEMRRAVEVVRGRALLEASGGITLDNVRRVAETGVDFISVGAITHSPRALDLSLEM